MADPGVVHKVPGNHHPMLHGHRQTTKLLVISHILQSYLKKACVLDGSAYPLARVNNKEERRVSKALYTPCKICLLSNVTSRLVHMTKPRRKTHDFSQDCEE